MSILVADLASLVTSFKSGISRSLSHNNIEIVLAEKIMKSKDEMQPHIIFDNIDDALNHARKLKNIYGVNTIKIK